VMLKKTELFKTVIPTKLLEYMACARPVIVAVDGQSRQIIEQAQAGIFVPPEDSLALVRAVGELAQNPARRDEMGSKGRDYIETRLSREKTAREYISLLEVLVRGK
jgi:glycosyltransferase involved in cell wall biosynthesis